MREREREREEVVSMLASMGTPVVPVCHVILYPISPRLRLAAGPLVLRTPYWFPADG